MLSPSKAATILQRAARLSEEIHGTDRFPIDIDTMALGAAELFKWPDPITEIQAVSLPNFEGMLASNESKTKWMLAYNDTISSPGRIRFTKAHELGHYMLHRANQDQFNCTKEDMLVWSDGKNIEAEADRFASALLMPIDDFREQARGQVCIDNLAHCADRYGVSLTSCILKWLEFTSEKAVLIISKDGFIDWSCSSKSAKTAGAFFKTRSEIIELPPQSLAANERVVESRIGVNVAAKTWFPHADTDGNLIEMKVVSEQYDFVMSLLILPRYADFWPQSFSSS